MGASGSGKSTVVSLIVGLDKPDSGEVKVFGNFPGKQTKRVGFMPQTVALINEFTIREILWFYGTIYGLSTEAIREKSKFLSEILELPCADTFAKACSGGEQRRISLAIALIHDPQLLILDEPTVGLDPILREKIWNHLAELAVTQNVTIFLTTHYVEEARQSSCVGFLRNGKLLAQDSPRQILWKTSCDRLDDAFLSISERQENFGTYQSEHFCDVNSSQSSSVNSSQIFFDSSRRRKLRKPKILKALLWKNSIELLRNVE
jgi:ABC-type multidrug transport system ATPase subunit